MIGNSIWLPGAHAPGANFFLQMSKKLGQFFLCDLCHIQMLSINFEAKRLCIFACAKKKQIKDKMSPQNYYFHQQNTPFHMKIVKHACDTNTTIYKVFQKFFKTFTIFFGGTVHPGACAPESQNAAPHNDSLWFPKGFV
jgi:hypothetical protein